MSTAAIDATASAAPAGTRSPPPVPAGVGRAASPARIDPGRSRNPAVTPAGSVTGSAGQPEIQTAVSPADNQRLSRFATTLTAHIIPKHLAAFFAAENAANAGEWSENASAAAKALGQAVELFGGAVAGTAGTGWMNSLHLMERACTQFIKPPPCKQMDEREMWAMLHPEAREHSKVTKDLLDWYKQVISTVGSLNYMVDHPDTVPGLPANLASKLKELGHAGWRHLASGLCQNAHQFRIRAQTQVQAYCELGSRSQAGWGTNPTVRQSLHALSSMERSHQQAIRLTEQMTDLAAMIDFAYRCLAPKTGDDFAKAGQSTNRCTGELAKTNLALREDASRLAVFVNIYRLRIIEKAARTSRSPAMRQLATVSGKAGHLTSSIDNLRERLVESGCTHAVIYGLLEHVSQQCHEVEVDLLHMGMECTKGPAFGLAAAASTVLNATADALSQFKLVLLEMVAARSGQGNEPTPEDKQNIDLLKTGLLSHYREEPDAAVDLFALGASAVSAGADAPESLVAQTAALSLGWIDSAASPPATRTSAESSSRRRGSKATASAAKPTPATSSHRSGELRRARENFAEAFSRHPHLASNALRFTQAQVALARGEVDGAGDFPASVATVKSYVARAGDSVKRAAEWIGKQLHDLRVAKDEIEKLEPDSPATKEQMRSAARQMGDWQRQIDELRARELELGSEADTLGRAQLINVFLAYPTYRNYKTLSALSKDSPVALTVERTTERRRLPPMNQFGFEKPNGDYLDVYRITVRTKSDAHAWNDAGHVELHCHYDSPSSEQPRVGHFKNLAQSALSGPSVHRGSISEFELSSVVEDMSKAAMGQDTAPVGFVAVRAAARVESGRRLAASGLRR